MTIKVTYNVTDVYMTQSVSPVYINVSYSGGGTSGGGVWGTITGTLSNQTDLQTALDGKFDDPTGTTAQYLRGDGSLATFPSLTGYVPYTGATTNVDLGEYELKAGQLTLDVSPTGTAAVGTTRWNDTTGVSETTLKGGSVLLRNGVDLVARVVNKVTPNTTLTKAAYQAVRVSGAQGQRLAVAFAQANNDANSADTIGLVIETIPTNQEGFIMAVGQLENINTTGSLQGETWVDGDVLYLSPTTAGSITKVKPTGNGHIVVIGYVEYAHANNGKIYVKVMNGWELTELHDTEIVSPANNEALIYESSTSLWKNKTIATALGYTPANAATTLTINGVTYDLSTSRTWTIAAGISGSGTAGQVTYWSGASAVSGSNNLFWDNANGRLGIGTNTPANALHISTNSATAAPIQLRNTNSQGFATFYLSKFDGSDAAGFGYVNAANTTAALANRFVFYTFNNTPISFTRNSDFTPNLFIAGASGNIGINNDAPTVRLDVRGDTLLRGSGSTIATTALTVQNSSSTNLLRVLNDGDVSFGADAMYWDAVTSRLGIGTNAPSRPLTINFNANDGNGLVYLNNPNTGSSANAGLVFQATTASGSLFATGSGYTTIGVLQANRVGFYANASFVIAVQSGDFIVGTASTLTERMRLFGSTGNLSIGTNSDLGTRLGVVGDTLLRGSGATSATNALTVQDSGGTAMLTLRNDGVLRLQKSYLNLSTDLNVAIGASNNGNSFINTGGGIMLAGANRSAAGVGFGLYVGNVTNTSGDFIHIQTTGPVNGANFAPTSGTGTFTIASLNATINQTGGANGITRGLYVNPTLTAAADFRAIETARGNIVFSNLPTSSAGLPSGALWNNAGVINIV